MNLKNDKGYVGIDASIAVLILIIIVPVITGMIYNINKTNSGLKKKTEAVNIAVNVMESIKGLEFEDLYDNSNIITKISKTYTELEGQEDIQNLALTKDSNTYKISISIKDYAETEEGIANKAEERISKDSRGYCYI